MLAGRELHEVVGRVDGEARQVLQGRGATEDFLRAPRFREAELPLVALEGTAGVLGAVAALAGQDDPRRRLGLGGRGHLLRFRFGREQLREQGLDDVGRGVGRAEARLVLDLRLAEEHLQLGEAVRAALADPLRVETVLLAQLGRLGGELGLVGLTRGRGGGGDDDGGLRVDGTHGDPLRAETCPAKRELQSLPSPLGVGCGMDCVKKRSSASQSLRAIARAL